MIVCLGLEISLSPRFQLSKKQESLERVIIREGHIIRVMDSNMLAINGHPMLVI